MKKSSLINVLSSFSVNEMKEFSDYIHSPFFNKNKSVIKIFNYIKTLFPTQDDDRISKKEIWKHAFKDTAYNDGLLRIYMFTLTNLAIDYLHYKEMKSDTFNTGNQLLSALNKRNLNKHFKKNSLQLSKNTVQVNSQSEAFYYNKYRYEYENVFYQHKMYIDRKENLIDINGIKNIAHYATLFQVIVMLKTYLYFLNTKQIYKTSADTSEFEKFTMNLNIDKYHSFPVIPLLYHSVKLHTDENNQVHFNDLRKGLFTNFRNIYLHDAIEVIINMENYCKRMIRKGMNEYTEHLFEIYEFELDKKTYQLEHCLSERMYISVTETAITLGKQEWAAGFVEEYKDELNESAKESTYRYSKAIIEFSLKNYSSAVDMLNSAGYTDDYNKFEVKNLLIACYFELNMFDEMEGVIDSYRHLLKSDKYISAERKKYYSNFIFIAKKLIRLKTRFSSELAAKLNDMLKQPGFVIDVKWLQSKIIEAENRNNVKV